MVPNAPQFDTFSAKLSGGLSVTNSGWGANNNGYEAAAVVNIPLSDILAARFSFHESQDPGYINVHLLSGNPKDVYGPNVFTGFNSEQAQTYGYGEYLKDVNKSTAAGGRVAPHPKGLVEVGYVDIKPTEAGREWFKAPMKVYEWHREGMIIPDCCELIATNESYPVQGFRCGSNAFGFQFHPEVTLEMKEIWTMKAAERLKLPGAQQRGVHLAMHALYDPPLDRWINGFLDRWLATDARN